MLAASLPSAPYLGDRFVLTELLGAGAFGRVYRATDRRYSMQVALKVLTGFQPEALRLFKDEFRALAHVSHTNLVTLYELHAFGEAWFYTMEHVRGATLGSWVSGTHPSPETLRQALFQMGSGIAALHEAGLCHRDLKPSNVLVSSEGRVAVSDFGLVGALDPRRGTTHDRVIGTVAYSAPEVWMRAPVGPAADWYAFGITIFELLTGQLPFDAVQARTLGDGPRPSSIKSDVPPDLDELCARLLKRDPKERPAADACLSVLAGRDKPLVAWTASASRFVARAEELDALDQALDASRTQGTQLHLVGGPSGIGKTSLVEEANRRAVARGALVLKGRCHPQDALLARGLDGVVDALGRYIARCPVAMRAELVPDAEPALRRMFPTLADVLPRSSDHGGSFDTSKEERQAALTGLSQILLRVALRTPLVLAIDDLHWADEATGSAIVSVLQGMRGSVGVLFVGTFRGDHLSTSPCLKVLREAFPALAMHMLGPLPPESAEALVAEALGHSAELMGQAADGDEAPVEAILRAAQGNPYLLVELASHARTAEPEKAGAEHELFDRVVLSRVRPLTSSARRVLEVLTIAGMPLPVDVVIDAAELGDDDYLGDLTTLRANRLVSPRLSEGRESLEAYHGRVREALARSIPKRERPALHGKLARALARSPSAPRETIAQHFFAAEEMAPAYEAARAAAVEARASLAFGRAIAMLELASATGIATEAQHLELQRELADALANAGRGAEASQVFSTLATLEPEHADSHERRAAEQLLFSGHLKEGLEVLGRVLQRVGLSLPRSRVMSVARVVWAQALGPGRRVMRGDLGSGPPVPALFSRVDACNTATLGLTMTDPLASAVMQAYNLESSIEAREPERLARALSTHMVHTAGGWYDPARTRHIGELIDRQLEGAPSPQTVAWIALSRAGAAWMEGRLEACLDHADTAIKLLRRSSCVGMQWHLNTHHVMELEVLESLGRWNEVAALLTPYLHDAKERGDRFLEASLRVRFRPTLLLAEGRVDAAREEIAIARRSWDQAETTQFDLVALYGALREAWCHLYAGDVTRAQAHMEATWKQMESSLLVRVVFYRDMAAAMRATCLLAFARSASGKEQKRALEKARTIEAGLRATSSPLPLAHAAMLAAAAQSIEGHADAARRYEEAARAFDALGLRLVAAACRHRAGAAPEKPTTAALADPAAIYRMLAP